jgi:solute carrier family 25 phosphate transporter 23/24/25/41
MYEWILFKYVVCTLYMQLIRRRLQVAGWDPSKNHTPLRNMQRSTFFGELNAIVKKDGMAGLYRGIVPNYLKIVPAAGINFVVFEKCKHWFLGT